MAFSPGFPQRPHAFLTCAWVCARRWFGYPAVRGGWPRRVRERGRDETRPAPRPPSPTELHKLYELVVASYLRDGAS